MPRAINIGSCWLKSCGRVAVTTISFGRKQRKVCKGHADNDGLHWNMDGNPCRCKKDKC